ncbi:MAG: hypothetical protein JNM26_03570 [Ideonella sp.]|nr:hypothetical protein [Ideonella sp.]
MSALCLAAGLAVAPAASAATTKPAAKAATKSTKPAGKSSAKSSAKSAAKSSARSAAKAATAKPVAKAAATGVVLTEAQATMASQVHVGRADCEFKQYVVIARTDAGTFRLRHAGVTYTMVPEETSTGAVRLLDRKTGVVWIQIPVKSMLMNSRAGRRMVDACMSPAQRQAQADADAAALAAASAASAAVAAGRQPDVPPSLIGREDRVPAGMMTTPTSADPAASAPPGRL